MLGMSIWKIAIIGGIVMVMFGRGKVSELMGDVAKGIKSFKKGMADQDEPAPASPRAKPKLIDGSRRRRIARGSGTSVQAVSQLVKQFAQMQKMMRQLSKGRMPDLQQLAGGR